MNVDMIVRCRLLSSLAGLNISPWRLVDGNSSVEDFSTSDRQRKAIS